MKIIKTLICAAAISFSLAFAARADEVNIGARVITSGGRLNARSSPSIEGEIIGKLNSGAIVHVIEASADSDWVAIEWCDSSAFVSKKYLSIVNPNLPESAKWLGPVLNKRNGTVLGPSGRETYYNLNMNGVIKIMRRAGYHENDYPYWEHDNGCKMFGPYIMCAANLNTHPRGSLIETSLGTGIVCDTGDFAYNGSGVAVDVAVTWQSAQAHGL